MDEAAAKLKMEITSKPEALDAIDRQVGLCSALPSPVPALRRNLRCCCGCGT
jgi:hypothetical protein